MSSKKARSEVDGEVETQVSSDEELQRVDRRHQKGRPRSRSVWVGVLVMG